MNDVVINFFDYFLKETGTLNIAKEYSIMRVSIKQIPDKKAEQVVIECVEINEKVERIKVM